jgi:hypothetical protein
VLATLGALAAAVWLPGGTVPVRSTSAKAVEVEAAPREAVNVAPRGRRAEAAMQDVTVHGAPATLLLATEPPRSGTRDPVTFVLALDNPGVGDAMLTFSSSQVYDVTVLAGDVEIWRWSGGMGFGAVITDRSYPVGVTLLGRERWDWRDANGAPVPPGRYRAVASLATIPPRQGNVIELTLDLP